MYRIYGQHQQSLINNTMCSEGITTVTTFPQIIKPFGTIESSHQINIGTNNHSYMPLSTFVHMDNLEFDRVIYDCLH